MVCKAKKLGDNLGVQIMSEHNPSQQKSFIVEGNIGAGKSTFLKLIEHRLDIQVVLEPHEQWQKVGDTENLLEKFYADTQRWAYTFQTYAFVTRIMSQQEYAKKNIFSSQLLERSVYSDRYCFAHVAHELGNMNALEWKLYQEWFTWLVDNYTTKPSGFIYLRTSPETCYKRLKKRCRKEEIDISLDYLQALHNKHEKWLIEKEDIAPYLKHVPVLSLPCDVDFENNMQEQERHIEKIISFFDIQPSSAQNTYASSNQSKTIVRN